MESFHRKGKGLFLVITGLFVIVFISFHFLLVLEERDSKHFLINDEKTKTVLTNSEKRILFDSLVYTDEYLKRERNEDRLFRDEVITYNPRKIRKCGHIQTERDFHKFPLLLDGIHLPSPWDEECPVGCSTLSEWNQLHPEHHREYGDIIQKDKYRDYVSTQNPLSKCCYSYSFTMENIYYKDYSNLNIFSDVDISGTTSLLSEVPLPYYSWIDCPIFETEHFNLSDKLHSSSSSFGDVAAFISNCGPQKRLKMMQELMDYNPNLLKVDSFGNCHHSKDEPSELRKKYYPTGGNQMVKKMISKHYLFIYSAENSETDDYVTEKFFLPFVIGSIPLYLGAPNILQFAPSPNSFISMEKYENDTSSLAKLLIDIKYDRKRIESMIEWKESGRLSRHFLSIMDFPIVHSSCRMCMRAADYIRKEYNNQIGHEPFNSSIITTPQVRYFRIRERNTFYLKYLYFEEEEEELTIVKFFEEIRKVLGFADIYKVYYLWDRKQIPIDQKELDQMENGKELEVIFLDSNKYKRESYTEWLKEKGKL